jgi:hypothetical protein
MERIKVNRNLDKRPWLGPLPGNLILPWGSILLGVFLGYIIINRYYPISPYWALFADLVLTVSHWILFGERPWEYGGKFHTPQQYALGYPKLQPNKEQLRSRIGKKAVGLNSSKRRVTPIEDELHIVSVIRFQLGGKRVGAYLLQKGKIFRIVFGFDCLGISRYQEVEQIQSFVNEKLLPGIKDFFPGEIINFHMGSFSEGIEKERELEKLFNNTSNYPLKFLLTKTKARVKKLILSGKHNPKFFHIYISYTFNTSSAQATDGIEELLATFKQTWENYKGTRSVNKKQELKELLHKSYNLGYRRTKEFLSNQLSLSVRPLTDREMFIAAWKRINDINLCPPPESIPQLLIVEPHTLRWEINSDTHISTGLFVKGAPKADKQWVYLPGRQCYVGGAIVQEKPGGWKNVMAQILAGSEILHHPDVRDTEIFVQLSMPNQELARALAERNTKQSNLNVNLATDKKLVDVGASYNTRQNIEIEEAFHEGEKVINVAAGILVYRRERRTLADALASVCSLFPYPGELVREQEYFDLIWLETLPIVYSLFLDKPYQRKKKFLTKEVIGILPLVVDRSSAKKGVELISSYGNTPINVDVFSKPSHSILLAATGGGKSVLAAEFLTRAQAEGMCVTVIDSTRADGTGSFDAYTKFLGGSYFNCISESNNLFETVDLAAETNPEIREAKKVISHNLILEGLVLMVSDGDTPKHKVREYRTLLNRGMSAFFADEKIVARYGAAYEGGMGSVAWNNIPTLRDYLQKLTPESLQIDGITLQMKEHLASIRLELESILDSPLGRAIASPSTVRMDSPLVIYAIGGIDNESDLAVLALSAYSAAIRRSLSSPSSFLFFDEASYLVGNFDCFARIIGALWAKARKSGISAMLAGQDLNSILQQQKIYAQILDNTDNILFGKLKTSALKTLSNTLEVPKEILRLNTLDTFTPSKEEFATNWLLKTDSKLTHCHYYPALEQLALLVNEPATVSVRNQFQSQYSNKYEALTQFTKYLVSSTLKG